LRITVFCLIAFVAITRRYFKTLTLDARMPIVVQSRINPKSCALPRQIAPLLAKSGALPANDAGYAFEFKWDGFRAVVILDRGKICIQSRNLHDMTPAFPELHELAAANRKRRIVLDGEIIALGDNGKPDFELLQGRFSRQRLRVQEKALRHPVTYMAFDLLHLDGRDLMPLPYSERRALLDDLALSGPFWQTPKANIGNGKKILAVSRQHRLEGIVAKRLDAAYEIGKRTGAWIKVKNFVERDFIIGGWIPSSEGGTEALLIGEFERRARKLCYVGRVELGKFWQLRPLFELLKSRECPFIEPVSRRARFLLPKISGRFRYLLASSPGNLRHVHFVGLK
jgi:bifunctional non-homologous end joining protein LigD